MVDCIAEPQWADYIGVHYSRGKKPLVETRQVGVTYYPNLPYLEISLKENRISRMIDYIAEPRGRII
jgi:hypothetical protein